MRLEIKEGQIWLVRLGMGTEIVCKVKKEDFRCLVVVERLDKDVDHYFGDNNFIRKLGDNLEDAKMKNSAYFI